MNIALIGYGKMGQIIDKIATQRGHNIVVKLNETPKAENLAGIDVAIEFSQPEVAFENIKICLENKIPVICGTTGWLGRKQEIEQIAEQNRSAFIYSSNFSLGVNLFFALNEKLANLMRNIDCYTTQLEEIHHIHKKDAPSGTAISLAEGIMKENPKFESWKLGDTEGDILGINAIRDGEVPGTHSVRYCSEVDEIEIKHTAFSREGFALGAVLASEWIIGKEGIFKMKDVLGT